MASVGHRPDNVGCERCGQPAPQSRRGRARRFCGEACRSAHRRATAAPSAVAAREGAPRGGDRSGAGRAAAGPSGPAKNRSVPGLVICAITGRGSCAETRRPAETPVDLDAVPDAPAVSLPDLWRPRFPNTDMLTASAALLPARAPWQGQEGPRPRVVISPGAVAVEAPDLAKRERAAERLVSADRLTADAMAAYLGEHGELPPDRPSRRTVMCWSRKSRSRMVRALCEIDYAPLLSDPTRVPAMITLTYPGDWVTVAPTGPDLKRHFAIFKRRYRRAWGRPLRCIWKLEFQRRGAPHLHLLMVPPVGAARGSGLMFRQWLSATWAEVVDHPDPMQRMRHERAGTGVDFAEGLRATDPKRVAVYFTKHGTFTAKEYQNRVPREWREPGAGPGRFWGYCGLRRATVPVEVAPAAQVQAARVIRRWARAQGTTREVRAPRGVDAGTGRVRFRRVRRRVNRLPNGVGWVSVNDGAAFASQLARALG